MENMGENGMDRMYNFKLGVSHLLTFDILLQLGQEGNFAKGEWGT